ncbi:MAG: sigma-54-dependent Fis family transcriptional regulator [Phycisphaerae bacterium]|nr:sigma-54-dependent Fis family transcriptional regulator [Phycisphaerae bacterium]
MPNDAVILIVDDEKKHADGIAESLEKLCKKAMAVYSGPDALELIAEQDFDIIITGLRLGDTDGMQIMQAAKNKNPDVNVILMTAYASIENCKEALRGGAYDYLVKPIDIDQLRKIIQQLTTQKQKSDKPAKIVPRKGQEFAFDGVKGNSSAMKGILEVLRRVAATDISVLIEGQSGTGKELLAKAVHDNSLRKDKPFKPINCAGLAETLLESELFGHVKGAFSGAVSDRKGLFEIADKGTLFLDEIGDMPLNMQAKLLRVLEDGIVVPVGSNKSRVVDVRIISATNHDLISLIEKKKFRQDLYFRIKGVSITVPSLQQRVDDIPLFADFFTRQAANEVGSDVKTITQPALKILQNYSWPGNIRQLRNVIRTMVVMCDRDRLDLQDIPPEINMTRRLAPAAAQKNSLAGVSLGQLEKQAIIDTLAKTDNNREKAAKILGIGERTLYRKIKEYGLNV